MRICLDIRSRSGGGLPVYINSLVPRLLEIGREHEFLLVCHADQHIGAEGPEVIHAPEAARYREFLWVQTGLPGLLRRRAVDVYHALKHLGPLFVDCISILSLHEVGQHLEERTLPIVEHLYWSRMQTLSLRRADHVIAVSDWAKDVVVNKLGVKRSKVTAVPLGVDAVFTTVADLGGASALRERLRIPGRFLLAVGNVSPKKNFGTILEALARLRSPGYSGPPLVIAGGQGFRSEDFFAHVRGLGLGEQVFLTGFLGSHELAHLYRCAEALVYPSLYEAFGLPPIEAMACGCPVITSKRGAIPSVTGGFAWYLDDPTDAEALAAMIRIVLEDRERRERLVADARAWVRRYSWDAVADATLSVYERLGAGNARQRDVTSFAIQTGRARGESKT